MKQRLMIVNVYFSPNSFGGATIVAEQMAWRLSDYWDILVVTAVHDPNLPPFHCSRYRVNNVDVVGINLHPDANRMDKCSNPYFACEFGKQLAAFKPDIVHFHSIQEMGAEMLKACELVEVPTVVTVHDNWWICERQFMVNGYGQYCWQEIINLKKCKQCLQSIENGEGVYGSHVHRFEYLTARLRRVDKILFPSKFQRDLYQKNIAADLERCLVNKNGVQLPTASFERITSEKVRFGFVGGINGTIKGFDLVLKSFAEIDYDKYELLVVDNTLNLGYSSIEQGAIPENINVKTVPAYTQETMDDFFAQIDVLLFPSQGKESFGLTVREALVRDIWVICTDGGGTAEEVIDGENGAVISLGEDYHMLSSAINNSLAMNFTDYTNQHKAFITSFDNQAEELHDIFLSTENLATNRKEKSMHIQKNTVE
ncbi:MAG: glycosyltransferase family 4 protein [Thermodesulfobacteriota bacterium]|nr:glycosyltransferase family 4 protein [Thermodesulfobacteriota bacterium]